MPTELQPFASPEVQAFANGFPVALLQALVSLVILLGAVFVHSLMSPHKDVALIREGNPAAAISFGGVALGLALPLARSLMASTSVVETVIWGLAATVLALLVFRVIDLLLRGLPQRVKQGDVAAAALLVAAKVASALIIAAAFSG
jgi:putative membrane protein